MRSKHHRQYGQQVGRAEEARTQMVSGLLDQFDQLEILRALIRAAQHKENTGQSHTQLTDEPEVRPDQTEQEATANSAETAPAKDPKAIETHLSSTRLESPRPSAFGYADATQQVGGRVSNQIAVLGTGDVDFRFLEIRFSGPAGARDAFERLVADIVSIVHPDVREIQANPGDWGIDAFVGDLGEDGEVHIWQSKYFINGFGSSQQSEVRDSYKSAQKAAGEQGYRIASWTLCIPCELDGPMLKWWDGWKKRTAKADSLTIELESGGRLRRKLQAPAGENVRKFYFSPIFAAPEPLDAEDARGLEELVDESKYDGALFVRQLDEAGLPETFSAREAFFNAEILEREVTDKGLRAEVSALSTWRIAVSSTWSVAFNTACQTSPGRRFPRLYGEVLAGIEAGHLREAAKLRAHALHGVGLLHQAVDNGRAGWVRDWREVARDHRSRIVSTAPSSTLKIEDGADEAHEQLD